MLGHCVETELTISTALVLLPIVMLVTPEIVIAVVNVMLLITLIRTLLAIAVDSAENVATAVLVSREGWGNGDEVGSGLGGSAEASRGNGEKALISWRQMMKVLLLLTLAPTINSATIAVAMVRTIRSV